MKFINDYLKYIQENFDAVKVGGKTIIKVGQETIYVDHEKSNFEIKNFENFDNRRIFDLSKEENWSVLILLVQLFQKGYGKENIFLEKTWKLGHNEKGSLDVFVHKNGKPFHLIEVKRPSEIDKYTSTDEKNSKILQLFSYIWQAKTTKFASYYTFDPFGKKHKFFTVANVDVIAKNSADQEDLYDRWNKFWETSNIILNNDPFDLSVDPISFDNLEAPEKEDTRKIFHQFLTILRTNSVSDKSNAFDKIINIFIAKVVDERFQNQSFNIDHRKVSGMRFQFIRQLDTSVSLMKRINDLYKDGMKKFLNKEIIDYSDDEIERLLKSQNDEIKKAFEDLRLKKNSAFSFVEVFDDATFEENARIVAEVVELLQKIKFEGNGQSQFLGDFFEELLNSTWKQEAGQFFTPIPMVKFIINALPIREKILENIKNAELDIIPKAIDYACGSGHFLITYMHKVQEVINELAFEQSITGKVKNQLKSWVENPYSWASKAIFGIEKDYRLVKTTKIATFLNGDGEANIIHGDGINKFSSEEYENSILYSKTKKNEVMDFVIANPPYSVKGFEKNLVLNGITDHDFELKKSIQKGMIESLFVERAHQLLKPNGICAIVLPRSILSVDKYESTRDFVFRNFKIISIFESGETSFAGTTTSPVIIFAQKQKAQTDLNYDIAVISSPKFRYGSTDEERKWLGYQFSSNKHKLGIEELNSNLYENIGAELHDFFVEKTRSFEAIKIKKMKDIIVRSDTSNFIYLNYSKPKNGHAIKELVNEFCPSDNINSSSKYIEISNLTANGKIVGPFKQNDSSKTALPGDIIFPKLVGQPSKFKIAIVEEPMYVTSAMAVLRISNEDKRNKIFNYLKNNKHDVLDNMFYLGDGFKSSYLKISDENLLENIILDI